MRRRLIPTLRARCAAAAGLASLLLAPPAIAELRSIETADLRLVYPDPQFNYLAPHTVRCFENAMGFYRRTFGYAPSEKVTVLLNDSSDYGNAAVWGSPRNTMMIQIAPPNFVYETGPSNERINFLMNHELGHVVTLDQTTGMDRLFRRTFFGKVRETNEHPESILYGFLTLPRRAAPRWHREGTAVFFETWMAGGLGRAQGPYDEMVFRAMVRDSARFYDPLGLESEGTKVDFQVGVNAYLYGTRFSTWLADQKSPAAFVDWVARRPGSRAYFANQFERVFGRPLTRAWREWAAWEREFQRVNLDSVRRHPTTASRDLSSNALGSVSRACLDSATATLYAAVYHPGDVAHVAAIPLDGGPIRKLREVKGPALYFVSSLAWNPEARTLFYTSDNNDWRDLCALDPGSGRSRVLIRDARIGDLTYNRSDSSLWGVRHFNGFSTVVRMPSPWTEFHQVFTFPYGRDIYDLDLSRDGSRLVASVGEISGRHSLRLFDVAALLSRDSTSRTLFDFGSSVPTSFVFSPDGRFLFGSSYYTGVSNIFRYDLAADSMDIVSNCETGFFRPVPLGGDSLVVFRYSGEGFVPAKIEAKALTDVSAITFFGQQVVERHPELRRWVVPSPLAVNVDSVKTYDGPYRALRSVRLVSLYPVFEVYKERGSVGASALFQDPLALHDAAATFTWTPDEDLAAGERWHLALSYRSGGITARFRKNPASFYDLFGPTKTSRRGTNASLEWSKEVLRDLPRSIEVRAGVSGWSGLERLPEAQNVALTPGFDRVATPSIEVSEKNLRSSIGSVDAETGYRWRLGYEHSAVRFASAGGEIWRDFPQTSGSFEAGVPLPARNASLWMRGAAGFSPGDRGEPFANFFFGGFGNNGVDVRDAKRYREPSAFPGLELDEAAGTTFVKGLLDVNLPPLRFRRAGIPALYASFVRVSLFGAGLVTNPDDAATRSRLADAGIQADIRFQLFTQQPFTLSAGWARAFEQHFAPREEWMLSLKVL